MTILQSLTKRNDNELLFDYILIFLIIFSPIFYGSLPILPLSILEITSFGLLGFWLLRLLVGNKTCEVKYPSGLFFIILFFLILLIQTLPLPIFILKMLSPSTFSLYKEYIPAFSYSDFYPLSIYSHITKEEAIKLFSFFAVFFVVLNTMKKRLQFKKIFLTIIIWALILAFYGLIKKYLIMEKTFTISFSTFGNKNHYAAYLVMVIPITVGYALSCRDKAKKFLLGFSAAIMCTTVFLSLSRAGTLSLIFSLVLMIYLLKREHIVKSGYWILVVVFFFSIIFVLIAGLGPIKEKFLVFWQSWQKRENIVKDSLGIIKDFPVFGVGFGNFQYIFTLYRKFISDRYYFYLHNDHLQLVVETGIVGAFSYFLFLFTLFKNIFSTLRIRRDPFCKSMVIGGCSGLLGVLFHSFFDFNFHIPAVAFLFWLILGLTYKCVYTHFGNEVENN